MPTRKLPDDIRTMRNALKEFLFHRVGKCEHSFCIRPNLKVGLALHEALVPVGFLRKIKDPENEILKHILFHPANIMLLHNMPCHLNHCPSREQALLIASKRPDSFYSEFKLHSFVYAAQHFFECFLIFQRKGLIKTLPARPENFDEVIRQKSSPLILS